MWSRQGCAEPARVDGKAGVSGRRGRRSASIKGGFGIALYDGVFPNVKTNIANLRLLAGKGHPWTMTGSPSLQRRLDTPSLSSRTISCCLLSLPYPPLRRRRRSPSHGYLFRFYMCRLCICMYMGHHI